MQAVTREQIEAMAPNQAAVSNAGKISQKGGFVKLAHSKDDTFYMGECKGSGAKNYLTSVDFIDPEAPVCRCSCPSRQFPCKHGLALMFEILEKKEFEECEIPEDILKKREKKKSSEQSGAKEEGAKKPAAKPSKAAKSAKLKKMKKQLEGLELLDQMITELLKAGLGTMGSAGMKSYEQFAKQLGNYYLPGPQKLLNRLILEITAFQKNRKEEHYEMAVRLLEKLWTLKKKSKEYLEKKTEDGNADAEDTELYEELGGIWKMEELEAIGRKREEADFLQLAFWVEYDAAAKEYVDKGCYVDLATGEIFLSSNYRPLKALKYIKEEDSVFHVIHTGSAVVYPGHGNPRIRWNGAVTRQTEVQDYKKVCSFAGKSIREEAKKAKNCLKNILATDLYISIISYNYIGKCENVYGMCDEEGDSIFFGNAPGMEDTLARLDQIPDKKWLKGKNLLGAFFYDVQEQRMKIQPLSILTDTGVVRLLY